MKKITSLLIASTIVSGLWAHPGHGQGSPWSPGHYVTSPEHAIQLTLAIAAAVIALNWLAAKYVHRSQKD